MHRFKSIILLCQAAFSIAICNGQTEEAAAIPAPPRNKIGLTYDYLYAQHAFAKTQQLISLEYVRQTAKGPVLLRSNFARRYGKNGWQMEVEAYPRFSKRFYSYINIGFSPDQPVLPKFRAGFSLYANLPLAFEAEAGYRFLYFDKSVPVYTASVGKYISNWWFNGRAFFTSSQSQRTQSYFLTSRYYLADADSYLSLQIGTGTSPDETNRIAQFSNREVLSSSRLQAGYRKSFRQKNIIMLQAALVREEYSKDVFGSQYNAAIQYQRKF